MADVLEGAAFTKVGDKWAITVDPGDGSPGQTYYGDTQEKVIAELVKAQAHATRTIRDQKKRLKLETPDRPKPIPEFKPRTLSADERANLAYAVSDPTQSAEAIRALIEAEFGASIETVRETLTITRQREARERVQAEATKFISEHPEFKVCVENDKLMVEYLTSRDMAYTAKNLAFAFDDLREHLLMNEPAAPSVVRPRSASTGILASGGAPSRVVAKPAGLSVEELNRLSPDEYRRKLSDPNFRAAVEKLTAPRSPRP